MKSPIISMICAIAENRAIGKNNQLLWRISEDMEYFRKITEGHPVIMGRKTYESIPKKHRPLPNRTNIIVTRNKQYQEEHCIVVSSLEEALEKAKEYEQEEIFIIGGAQIYELGMPYADRLYLTVVKGEYEADAFFPDYSAFTKVVSKKDSQSNGYEYTFVVLEKPRY